MGLKQDKDWVVAYEAASALGKIGTPAVPALLEALQDRDGDVRENAAEALRQIGVPAKGRTLWERLFGKRKEILP